MAEEPKEAKKEGEETVAEAPKAKGSKKTLLIVGGVLGVLLLAGIPVVMMTFKKEGTVAESAAVVVPKEELHPVGHAEGEEDLELSEGEAPLGVMTPMEPFVANLKGGRFLRLQFSVAFANNDIPSRWTTRAPLLRDSVVLLLTKKRADDILGDDGVATLKKEIKDVLNEALKKELVQDIYVSQVVVQ